MKILIITFSLLFSMNTQAGAVKEIYSKTVEEIEFYFQVEGDWTVDTVSDLRFIDAVNPEEILVFGQVNIRSSHTGKKARKECLVGFERATITPLFTECY